MDFENRNTNEKPEGQQETLSEQNSGAQQQDNNQPISGIAQQRQDPFEQRVNAGTHPYTTYQEWMETERKRTAKQEKHKERAEKKKNRNHKPILIVGSIAAACALFAGGIALGGAMQDGQNMETRTALNPNLPSVSISAPSNTMSTSASGLSGEEIYAKVSPSVVSVQAVNLQTGNGGTGSGVIMSADGYIITNQHVVTDENTGAVLDKITVIMSDGTNLPAAVKGVDQQTDLAVLKVEPGDIQLTPAEFGDSNNLKPGEEVFAIGSPGGLELANTITGGHISALNRDITIDDRVMSLIQTDAAINPGNSGGALINKYGQVIGITSAKLGISYFEGLGFAIPMDTAKPIVDELIQFGYIAGRPQIGISGRNVSEQTAAAYGIPQGVQIALVDSRSNAAAAGVQVNDIIIGVNGKTITNMDEINEVKDSMKAGDKITLKLYRLSTGKEFSVSFALNDQHDLEGADPNQQSVQQVPQQEQYYNNPFSYFFGR
ncbi:MAG: trypsin-like peptidase domain-containing protein [Butyricicoccus pullicaecorum]|nr:trypsin-like peptidase domain-containing protein [Butyricicoccus pullicaecorum]